ncbi:MAG: lipid A deacylase LpxR family protein [Alphaproteobacteria bacterium]|nr:lipid A deacylase LpxR family protein [Alphaproteobacteria bacterium]MDD9920422.1 lipid A deacylase LpxR family protein [Alphaproteobacteria bacterium]
MKFLVSILCIIPAFVWAEGQIFSLTLENDLFSGYSKDQNYTHGTRLSLLQTDEHAPHAVQKIAELLPWYQEGYHVGTIYSIGQNLYTPEDISTQTPNPKDRPYAAMLYGSVGIATASSDYYQVDELELMAGVVGPSALGKETQQLVHEAVRAKKPRGWHHQLKDEPILNFLWQRRWPTFLEQAKGDFKIKWEPHVTAALGNAHTFAGGGLTVSLFPKDTPLQDHPLRVRPALPGTGYYKPMSRRLHWAVFSGVESRFIARDIFLQGNSWQKSPSVTPYFATADVQAGFAFTYGKARLAYTAVYRTREFEGQNTPNIFGAVSLSWQF